MYTGKRGGGAGWEQKKPPPRGDRGGAGGKENRVTAVSAQTLRAASSPRQEVSLRRSATPESEPSPLPVSYRATCRHRPHTGVRRQQPRGTGSLQRTPPGRTVRRALGPG